ncbi:hypothetical protein PF003_g33571 [Phytophthora fragariae]|nr:hypothetical protein PF003_g33571 [Phytophthora fragariae]
MPEKCCGLIIFFIAILCLRASSNISLPTLRSPPSFGAKSWSRLSASRSCPSRTRRAGCRSGSGGDYPYCCRRCRLRKSSFSTSQTDAG